jgi:hypothetical protein
MLRGAIYPRHALTLLPRWPAVARVTPSMPVKKISLLHAPKHARLSSTPSLGFELALEQGLSGPIAGNRFHENKIATPCTIRRLLASLPTSLIYPASHLKHLAFAGDLGVLGTMKMDGGGEVMEGRMVGLCGKDQEDTRHRLACHRSSGPMYENVRLSFGIPS